MTSKELLLGLYTDLHAELVNVHLIPKQAEQLNHFSRFEVQDSSRNNFISLELAEDYIKRYTDNFVIAVSTTYFRNNSYYSFVGLDVEYPCNKENLAILSEVSKDIGTNPYIVQTTHGYHLFDKLVFENDLALFNHLCEYINAAAKLLNHTWVFSYTNDIKNSADYASLMNVAFKILNEIGHVERGQYTFFDLRHLARSICTNQRKSFTHGVVSQSFFRINSRNDTDTVPYIIGNKS